MGVGKKYGSDVGNGDKLSFSDFSILMGVGKQSLSNFNWKVIFSNLFNLFAYTPPSPSLCFLWTAIT